MFLKIAFTLLGMGNLSVAIIEWTRSAFWPVPTPFGLVSGLAHLQTLILPEDFEVIDGFKQVGRLVRKEADKLIVGYTFDLKCNTLMPEVVPNPSAGLEHHFLAWRLEDGPGKIVTMREVISTTIGDKRDNAE